MTDPPWGIFGSCRPSFHATLTFYAFGHQNRHRAPLRIVERRSSNPDAARRDEQVSWKKKSAFRHSWCEPRIWTAWHTSMPALLLREAVGRLVFPFRLARDTVRSCATQPGETGSVPSSP